MRFRRLIVVLASVALLALGTSVFGVTSSAEAGAGKYIQGFDKSRSWDYTFGPKDGPEITIVGFGSFVVGDEYLTARAKLADQGYTFGDGVPTITPDALIGVDIFVVGPLKGEDLTQIETDLLETFVVHGGAVLDARNWPSPLFGVKYSVWSGIGGVTFTNNDTGHQDILNIVAGVNSPVSVGAHSCLTTSGDGIPFLVDNVPSGNVSGVIIPPTSGRLGYAVVIGDEEIFSSNFSIEYGGGANYGNNPDNQQLLRNVFAFLSKAPGLDQDGPAALRATEALSSLSLIENTIQSMTLPAGQQSSLNAKLEAARSSVLLGQLGQAKNQLRAFINQVEAQRGKKLTPAQADGLIASARALIGGS